MSLSVITRPLGFKIASTGFQCTVKSSSSKAVFSKTNPVGQHGLIDGDYIYIVSNIEDYSGFFYVDQQDVNSFKILPYASGSAIDYVQNDTVTVYKALLTHGYNASELPIIYRLLSDLWPVNSVDTARTVSSVANDGGYVKLTLSGDIKATGSANELEFVIVTGANEGIYQIINYTSDTVFTINMPYTGGVSFSGSTVQYYYNNYHARIKLYAGLTSSHYWAAMKGYSEILTIKASPDASGIITINVNEFLKSALEVISENKLLGTLPNDIDSFCQFYISYAEVYDYSDSYTLQTNVGSYTSDAGNFEGVAVNAMLPFKNIHSGSMSDYLYSMYSDVMKFLTSFDYPEIFPGQWFELAWLNQYGSSVGVKIDRYLNGSLLSSSITAVQNYGIGVYKQLIQISSTEDRIDVSLVYPYPGSYRVISEVKQIAVNSECTPQYLDLQWKNAYGGPDQWRFNLAKVISTETVEIKTRSKNILTNWPKSWGAQADTVRSHTKRVTSRTVLVRCQDVTQSQIEDISGILSSPLVQIVNSNQDRRTVLVEDGDFTVYEELNKQNNISFKITYTDDLPGQKL